MSTPRFRDRLSQPPSKNVCDMMWMPALQRDLKNLDDLHWINVAHCIMLVESGLVSRAEGSALLKALLAVRFEDMVKTFTPELEDVYLNYERYLISEHGMDVCGNMHLGRSRNDIYATMTRMSCRKTVLATAEKIVYLAKTCCDQAHRYIDTVMPGYTHLQQAQPMTLAHYLCGVAEAFEETLGRLNSIYDRVNKSPMGACAFAGTHIPINRERVAELLGFKGLVCNTIRAVGDRSIMLDFGAALTEITSICSRVAMDLQIWTMNELDYITFPDSLSICSSIMPQKKNPVCLEYIRSRAGAVAGGVSSLLACIKNTPFTWIGDTWIEPSRILDDMVSAASDVITLLAELLSSLIVNQHRMRDALELGYITATDLAEALATYGGVKFRQAHSWVASLVADLSRDYIPLAQVPIDELRARFKRSFGQDMPVAAVEFAQKGPASALIKPTLGGPGHDAVMESLAWLDGQLETRRGQIVERRDALARASDLTLQVARRLSS